MSLLAVPLGLLAALLDAAASVLQRRAGSDESDDRAFSVRLLLDLVRRRVWVFGIVAIFGGFLAQAVALAIGGVATVQPLMVAELPFTFLLASVVFRVRPGRGDGLATMAITAGLALFLFCLRPEGGDPLRVRWSEWLVGVGATAAVGAAAVALGRASGGNRRAALLGVATGTGFGLTAALTAAAGAACRAHGPIGMLATWQPYAIVLIAPLSFFLLQNALQAGSLVASQPGLTLSNPVVAEVWGIAVFDDHVRGGAWTVGVLLGALLIAAGTMILARSPLLSGEQHESGPARTM